MTAENLTKVGGEEMGKVSLEKLASLTGFPVEVIKEELFNGESDSHISLDDLRSAMLKYIDSTMLTQDIQ